MSSSTEQELREQIKELVRVYFEKRHRPLLEQDFTPGARVNYAGRVFDEKEMLNLTEATLDFWLTSGRFCEEFEAKFAKLLQVKYCLLVNSGSSANLVAFSALTSTLLGERRIRRGDEVITVAAGFPTTVAPIIQFGAVPVFVDITVEDGSYNIDVSQLELARSERTKAVMIAHTLGNPFDLSAVGEFCKKHDLWLIEDNCDALGSTYDQRPTGTFGDVATSSFYPPHHMTMGEGGAVYTSNPLIKKAAESFRDWGRDCWCASGKDNTCKKRFGFQKGTLPLGYDHKYTYSHFGYNLKATEMQAAIGVAQIDKVASFGEKRRANFQHLLNGIRRFEEFFILPKATKNADPSWFGFILTVKPSAPFSRADIIKHLEAANIQTRMLFAGNLIRHPAFDEMRGTGTGFRVVGDLKNTDLVALNSFWVGVYPGMKPEALDFIIESIDKFIASIEMKQES